MSKTNERVKDDKLVSIICPSYNTASYISATIESVLNQTYMNWEMMIVDDNSTDNTDEIVAKYMAQDSRIRYIKNSTHCGAALTRNCALREARGRWIAFLDSDDLWEPDKLEKQICFMEENGYAFSYTCYSEMDADGNATGIQVSGPAKITKLGMYAFCWPGCLTVMYDASVIGLIQIEDIKKNNDYAMWLQVCRKANCYLLPLNLARYRRGRSGSVSSHGITTKIKWHYKLFHKAEKMSVVSSLLHTVVNIVFGACKKIRYVKKIS